jgi:protein-disulfide isomerase
MSQPTPKQERRRSNREQRRLAQEQQARRQRQLRLLAGVVAVAVIAAVVLIFLNRPRDTGGDLAIIASPIPAEVAEDGRLLGDPEAPVTIVEYGDYQCPFCGVFARESEPRLIEEFVATGQATYEYRDLAFLGDESIWASEAASCAEDQGAFWAYHKTLYANQAGENRGAFAQDRLREMASQLGLDMDAFTSCMDDRAHQETVTAMSNEARSQGISSTPTFVINGRVVPNTTYENLREVITSELDR